MDFTEMTDEQIRKLAVEWWSDEVEALFAKTIDYFQPNMEDKQISVTEENWKEDLQDYTIPEIEGALSYWRRFGKPFVPKTSEIIEIIKYKDYEEVTA